MSTATFGFIPVLTIKPGYLDLFVGRGVKWVEVTAQQGVFAERQGIITSARPSYAMVRHEDGVCQKVLWGRIASFMTTKNEDET